MMVMLGKLLNLHQAQLVEAGDCNPLMSMCLSDFLSKLSRVGATLNEKMYGRTWVFSLWYVASRSVVVKLG